MVRISEFMGWYALWNVTIRRNHNQISPLWGNAFSVISSGFTIKGGQSILPDQSETAYFINEQQNLSLCLSMKIVMVNLARHPNSILHPIIKCAQLGPLNQKKVFADLRSRFITGLEHTFQSVWSNVLIILHTCCLLEAQKILSLLGSVNQHP